jgi:hypothetical protein
MNSKSIVPFSTEKVKGLFISVPYNIIVDECHIKDKESMPIALMTCFGDKNAIPSFIPIVLPTAKYKIVGLSNKLDEVQMAEHLFLSYQEYLLLLSKYDITVSYSDFSNYWMVVVSE